MPPFSSGTTGMPARTVAFHQLPDPHQVRLGRELAVHLLVPQHAEEFGTVVAGFRRR